EVAGDERQVRSERSVRLRASRGEAVHPGAAALSFTREPVRVTRCEVGAVPVRNVVKTDVGVPHLAVFHFGDADAEQAGSQPEQALEYPVVAEVRPELLLVVAEQAAAQFFGRPGGVPRLKGVKTEFGLREVPQPGVFFFPVGAGALFEAGHEVAGSCAGTGHAFLQAPVRKSFKAEQAGAFKAEFEDAADEGPVVG